MLRRHAETGRHMMRHHDLAGSVAAGDGFLKEGQALLVLLVVGVHCERPAVLPDEREVTHVLSEVTAQAFRNPGPECREDEVHVVDAKDAVLVHPDVRPQFNLPFTVPVGDVRAVELVVPGDEDGLTVVVLTPVEEPVLPVGLPLLQGKDVPGKDEHVPGGPEGPPG